MQVCSLETWSVSDRRACREVTIPCCQTVRWPIQCRLSKGPLPLTASRQENPSHAPTCAVALGCGHQRSPNQCRLGGHRAVLWNPRCGGLVGHSQRQGFGGGLFSGRPQLELVDYRRVYIRVEYRLRACGRARGSRRHQRSGAGALRIARVVPAGAGLGLRSLLHALHGVHHAGVSGAALQRRLALRALGGVADYFRGVENCRGDFCRRRGLRNTFSRSCS